MNGLGFRPLRYEDGTGPQGVTLIEQFNNLFSQNQIPELVLLVQRNPDVFFDMERLPSNISGVVKELVDQKLVTLPPTVEAITQETDRVGRGFGDNTVSNFDVHPLSQTQVPMQQQQQPLQQQVDPGYWEAMVGRINPDPLGAPADVQGFLPGSGGMDAYPYQSGGHVQRMAHGGYSSRGTVAGELPRYGNMSVREEGETMHELSKRHGDQDWYNRMSGGLGSLRRRMA